MNPQINREWTRIKGEELNRRLTQMYADKVSCKDATQNSTSFSWCVDLPGVAFVEENYLRLSAFICGCFLSFSCPFVV
jgi:hypothetical protein